MSWGPWLLVVFAGGAVVGGFLDRVLDRWPRDESLVWPRAHCRGCGKPVRWYDHVPLLSYLLLRGRCRSCGGAIPVRSWVVELLSAAGWAGLFSLDVVANVRRFDLVLLGSRQLEEALLVTFVYHAVGYSYLLTATAAAVEHGTVPLRLTAVGSVLGLLGALTWPWPWPYAPAEAVMPATSWARVHPTVGPRLGLYAWPVWGPLPDWPPATTGALTGLAGLAVGFGLARAAGVGNPGVGLLVPAGAFLGWQVVVVGFVVGMGLATACRLVPPLRDRALAPALAVGLTGVGVGWAWVGPLCQPVLFDSRWLAGLLALGGLVVAVQKIADRRGERTQQTKP